MDAATGWCVGCQRTLQEIAAWSSLSDADKRAVWHGLPARHEAWLRLHPELRSEATAPVVPSLRKEDSA